jgi:hypothetical protein
VLVQIDDKKFTGNFEATFPEPRAYSTEELTGKYIDIGGYPERLVKKNGDLHLAKNKMYFDTGVIEAIDHRKDGHAIIKYKIDSTKG